MILLSTFNLYCCRNESSNTKNEIEIPNFFDNKLDYFHTILTESSDSIISTSEASYDMLEKKCKIQVCGYPYTVGSDFYTLYKVTKVYHPINEGISSDLIDKDVLVVLRVGATKTSDNFYLSVSNPNCSSNRNQIVFNGSLQYVKDFLIDRLSNWKYSGYYLDADSMIQLTS